MSLPEVESNVTDVDEEASSPFLLEYVFPSAEFISRGYTLAASGKALSTEPEKKDGSLQTLTMYPGPDNDYTEQTEIDPSEIPEKTGIQGDINL